MLCFHVKRELSIICCYIQTGIKNMRFYFYMNLCIVLCVYAMCNAIQGLLFVSINMGKRKSICLHPHNESNLIVMHVHDRTRRRLVERKTQHKNTYLVLCIKIQCVDGFIRYLKYMRALNRMWNTTRLANITTPNGRRLRRMLQKHRAHQHTWEILFRC